MGCGESKLAVATADGILRRKKSIANGSKSARKVADGSKSGADLKKIDEDVKVESEKKSDEDKIKSGADSAVADLKVASEKIDCGVKVESEKKIDCDKENMIEKREEKKSEELKIDGAVKVELEKIDDAVKIESEKKSDEVKIDETVKIESEKKIGEEKIDGTVNVETENKTEVQNVAKEGINGFAVEKQVVVGGTEAEKEAVVNGGGIEVKQEIKPVEEKQLAGEMKVEKVEDGINGGVAEENKLAAEPKAEKENGEAEKMKEEVPTKKEIAAPKVEETQISATPAAQKKSVKDVKENAADLPVKVSAAEEQK